MKDLILKTFNGIGPQKSYGGNSFAVNLANAEKAVAKVKYTENIFDRARSQFMLKHLTCSNDDDWTRMRQISAEMWSKRTALSEAKFGFMEKITEAKIKREEMEKETGDKALLLKIQAARLENQAQEMLPKMEGALKEIETLAQMHDSLKERLGEITEENFEKAQTKSHIKRALAQSIREVRECGTIRNGNQEYLEQIGVSATSALKEILRYLKWEESSQELSTIAQHKFAEDFAEKYADVNTQQAEYLGFDPNANNDLTYQ
tara:strand:+ start:1006 stop:1791 length:786 start_codon:yes stop_codon:yes gene_type:complete